VSQQPKPLYEFADSLPIEPIPAGTNVVVTGPNIGPTPDCLLQLLVGGDSEGGLLVTSNRDGQEIIADYERRGGEYDPGRMAVIDCSEGGQEDEEYNIRTVSSPSDLTGVGITFSSLYETLYKAGFERVRLGMLTITPLVMYVDDIQPVYRFLHTVTGRVRTADGFGAYAIDPAAMDEQTFRVVTQPFDGRIEVREAGDAYELRTEGLRDQPEGWQPFEPA
jgi:hypothetical protein